MNDFAIVMDKDLVDVDLLMLNEPLLPEAMRQLNLCEAIVGVRSGQTICVALLAKRKGYFDIVNLALDKGHGQSGADKELLLYTLDWVRAQGGSLVEIGADTTDLVRHEMFINMGFRVVGVWRDRLPQGGADSQRDILRYRIDLRS